MYSVEVRWAPAHELVASVTAYHSKKTHKLLDLGTAWASLVKKQLAPDFAADLAAVEELHLFGLMHLLITQLPGAPTAGEFIDWFAGLTPGELYERASPLYPEGILPYSADLKTALQQHARLLRQWYEQYFREASPPLLTGLQAEAEFRRALAAAQPPQEAVESATNGIVLDHVPGIDRVLLIPCYHNRPLNQFLRFHGLGIFLYPPDDAPTAPGELPPRIMRVLRAVTDESRLRILRYVAHESRSFMEIVKHTDLALSTVHHHLVALRAAGLVRVHEVSPGPGTGQNTARYSFRPAAVADLGARLADIIMGG